MNTQKTVLQTVTLIFQVILIVIMFVSLYFLFFDKAAVKEFLAWMGSMIGQWGRGNYLLLFLVGFLESFPFVGLVFPGFNIIFLVGGFFIAKQWDILPWTIVCAGLGSIFGNASGFFLGKNTGLSLIQSVGTMFGVQEAQMKWLEDNMEKRGFWFVFFGKFHNFTRSFMPYIAGAHHIKKSHFWLANILNSFVWAAGVLILGTFFAENYEKVVDNFTYIFLGIIIIWAGVAAWKNRRKTH